MARRKQGVDLRGDALWTGSHDGSPALRTAFAWLTRNGIGVRFGSRPVGWYQQHQIAAIDAITAAAQEKSGDLSRVAVRGGMVYAGSVQLGSTRHFFELADRKSRS